MKYAGWVLCLLFLVPALHALEIQAGSSFKITGITREQDKLQLPVERNKYYNIRILSKETLDFARACKEPCRQPFENAAPAVQEVRPAATREDMWIASVAFDRAWLVTFLVFKKKQEWTVKTPANFVFLDKNLETQTRELILQVVRENK